MQPINSTPQGNSPSEEELDRLFGPLEPLLARAAEVDAEQEAGAASRNGGEVVSRSWRKPGEIPPALTPLEREAKQAVERGFAPPPPPEPVVRVVGEPLDEQVLWVGRQWAVTGYGLECRDGSYAIEADRLDEDLLEHLASKNWVDIADLREALEFARDYFGKAPWPRFAAPDRILAAGSQGTAIRRRHPSFPPAKAEQP